MSSLKERLRKYREGNNDLRNIIEGVARFFMPPKFSLYRGSERGYIYFQEFIPGNDHDIRVIVIGDMAFAIKGMVRENDFRASGSGKLLYDRSLKDIELAFRWHKPAIISSHRVNFCGHLDPEYRARGLRQLDILLDVVIRNWPETEFVTTNTLFESVLTDQ